ncbi:MAG TPA: dolichyl-phosphate-mannose--protein mannosyltransferase [Legionellales bacterium]|nr:dolichyl-phosphate-mannose--protein mannosyltransferase [Legionellales bacterium]
MFSQERVTSFFKNYGLKSSLLILLVLFSRLIAMYWIPLNDSTEARYAEIARLMLTSHNWVSLMHYPGEYFWAKPPLSTWLSALSMQSFGINAFAARLPGFILTLISLGLVAQMAKTQLGEKAAFWSVGVLSTCVYFLLDAGTVMTDPSLLTCVVLVMVSFWMAMNQQGRLWAYMVFVGWGLGILVKGLVAGLFTVLPIMVWLTLTKEWKNCWKTLPWFRGTLLTLVIAAPWYILAEQRTPGFLSYFFIGEHFMRYLKPGWTGDLYGFAHEAPYGTIWFYFLVGVMPWSIVLGIWAFTQRGIWKIKQSEKSWQTYLLSFTFAPLIFFTFASNIIYPYVFPCIPAFALWFTTIMLKTNIEKRFQRFFNVVAVALILAIIVVTWLFHQYPVQISKSNNLMIAAWEEDRHSPEEGLIYSMMQPEYSTMFYSAGQAKATLDEVKLCEWLRQGPQYVVLNSEQPSHYDDFIKKSYPVIYVMQHRQRIDTLYRVDSFPLFCQSKTHNA